ncbi:MAG: molecular chaperone HtpG [Verrucomicrobiae bacterium]|nr:molecular chaperone HtpG [Verrucomicrobiae bacterium]
MLENASSHAFQAEVQQLLDIVIHSLYTDKEIFVRELVSNAADALEKLRHTQLTEKEVYEADEPLEIRITTDDSANTITIADSGIGMTREELVENLGTIAHSGSKKFMQALSEAGQKESSLIGQFGVGFYSAFMVADDVKVYTHSWKTDGEHLVWSSDGKTGYEIEEAPGQKRGSRIVVHLREDQKEFSDGNRIKGILESYSSFVPFPILLNGERVNKVEALWRKPKNDITDEEYTEFYKFIGKAWDEPRYRMHFSADAPLEINALLFVPQENTELFGFGQMEAGVSLYCKNVLIDDNPEGLLPEWLRFLRGVIDSADLPLNISRESMQDSALVRKLNRVVTKRFLKFLDGEAKSDAEKYGEFYQKFSRFLKEGIATDHESKDSIAKLLRFESSMTEKGDLTSLDDYQTRAKDEQDSIYYLIGDSRAAIEAGPYLEAFQARGLEVLFLTEPIDDYVVRSLSTYGEKKLVSADRADLELGDATTPEEGEALAEDRVEGLCEFIKSEIGEERVEKVEAGSRLVGSPAVALNPDEFMSAQMRRMMQAMNPDDAPPPAKVRLEINARHELIKKLDEIRESNPDLAKLVVAQLFDNALLAAGLLDDKKSLITRGYDLMNAALNPA